MTTLRQAAQQALEQLQLTRIYVEKALSRAIDNKALPDTIADVRDDLVYHDEAITALRQWKFVPITENREEVGLITFSYSLR